MVACSLVHEGQVIPSRARIQVLINPFSGTHQVHHCRQCRRAPCARECPNQAIVWVAKGAYWAIDESLCDGCGVCVRACPFEAMSLVPRGQEVGAHAVKCDTCGGDPACVASCPRGALIWRGAVPS